VRKADILNTKFSPYFRPLVTEHGV